MDVTTSMEKDNQRRGKQEAVLNAIRNIKSDTPATVIQPNKTIGHTVSKSLTESAADMAGKVMVNKLLDSLF